MSRIVPLPKPAYASAGWSSPREHRAGNGQDRRREDRQRADHHREDRAGEDREQAPRLERSAPRAARSTTAPRPATAVAACATQRSGAAAVITRRACPVIATGSSTSAICCSVRIFFSRTSSMMPRPVFIASAASSVDALVADHRVQRRDGADAVLDVVAAARRGSP